jgi:hypothetical protein
MVAHVYKSQLCRKQRWEDWGSRRARQKVSKILSQKQARHDSFNLRYAGDRGRRTTVQFCLIVKTDRPYLRNKLKKKGWRSD